MVDFFNKPFDSLDENDIKYLVDSKIREHLQLDYKELSYKHNHDGSVNLLSDITAMANANGGYLIIGVSEDKSALDGTPNALVGIPNGDNEANWIQSICLSSIDEKIPDLHIRDIPLTNGLSCVLIKIPNSLRKPHMVIHEKHRSFNLRHGRTNHQMTMQEVKNMILSMSSYRSSLQGFIDERIQEFRIMAGLDPWMLIMATPIYVDLEKIDPLRKDVCEFIEKTPGVPDNGYKGIESGKIEPRLFGIETSRSILIGDQLKQETIRFFRNGHFEFCYPYDYRSTGNSFGTLMPIYSYEITIFMMHFLNLANLLFQVSEINEPIAITLFFINIDSTFLHVWDNKDYISREAYIWKSETLNISITINDLSNPALVSYPIISRLFNAFGYGNNIHFDKAGKFIKK